MTRSIVIALFCGVLGAATKAQWPTPPQMPSGPVQYVSNQEYDQMMRQGQLQQAGPLVWLEQYIARILRDAQNQAVVANFIRKNPNAPDLSQLLAPPRSQNSQVTLEGNYKTTITLANGQTQTIELTGQSAKLQQLSNTIVTASDPALKLALYTDAYAQYANTFTQYCGQSSIPPPGQTDIPNPGTVDQTPNPCGQLVSPATLISPAALQSASLDQINTALRVVASYGRGVLHVVPVLASTQPVACSAETGVGDAPGVDGTGYFGDQTNSVGDKPSSTGIYANFNFPSKHNVSCVKNQGNRGACHIFAAISAIEYLIARDTGAHVNLNEQDFMQRVKAFWTRDYYNDSGDAMNDLSLAQTYNYKFGYENAWDYNPSLSRPTKPLTDFKQSCDNYPYPSLELGCSESAPQSPEICTLRKNLLGQTTKDCSFYPVALPSYTSYASAGANNIWDINNEDLSIEEIYLALGFNNAVILAFNETDAFNNSSDGFVPYHPAEADNSIGGHSVHIIGYVSNEDVAANSNTSFHEAGLGGGYFIIKNSWGAGAGDAGYYYMPVDYLRSHATGVYVVSSFQQN